MLEKLPRLENLPDWIIPNMNPAFNDLESATALEMVYKLYGEMQETIDAFNASNISMENFQSKIVKICNNYIKVMDMKIDCQDRKVADAIQYMKDNLTDTIKKLNENDELDLMILEAVSNAERELKISQKEYEEKFNSKQASYENKINSQVRSLASGCPLVASSVNEMTDTSKTYVNTSDGNWYYYNGTEWIIGGVYQASAINPASIDLSKLDFIEYSPMILNKDEMIDGKRISHATGIEADDETCATSLFIPVKQGETLHVANVYNGALNYYDNNKNWISGYHMLKTEEVTIPENCFYIKVSVLKAQIVHFYIGRIESICGTLPYYIKIKDLLVENPLINEKTIKEFMTSFIRIGNNKYNKNTVINGKFRSYSNNNENENASFCYSDFIKVKPLTDYFIYPAKQDQICFYNKYFEFIGGILLDTDGKITTPENAEFMCVSSQISLKDTKMISESTEAIPFEEYKLIIDDLETESKVFYVGANREIKTLKEGIEIATSYNNAKVYVDPGEYNLINEFGNAYFENFTANQSDVGLVLKNDIHIVFSPNSKVICHYRGTNENVQKRFAPFNAGHFEGSKGFTIENLTLECSNTRYAIHDEHGNDSTFYKNHYINCNIDFDNSLNTVWGASQCIGGGLGRNGEIIIENSIFNSHRSTYEIIVAVSYHNSGVADAKSKVTVKECYFKGKNSMRFSYYGESTEITDVIICNNSLGSAIDTRAETEDSTINNMNVIQFNNEIRTN